MGRRIVLLRHGRTGDNAEGRIQGQLDTPLDDVGRAQAKAVAPLLAAAAPALLLSSDLQRARDTAAPLAAHAGLTPRLDARLRELDLGTWQGLTVAEAGERFPEEHAAWQGGVDVPRGGGETYREAGARAVACLVGALEQVPAAGVLIAVTHGGTARAAACTLLGTEPSRWRQLGGLDNTCWSVLLERDTGWRLEQHGAGVPALAAPASWAGQRGL